MDEPTKKAYGYIRVSTEGQADGASPQTQKDAIQAYADRNNIEVIRWFDDLGISAKTAHRPGLQELIKAAKEHKGEIDYLIVYNVSRISRSVNSYMADIGRELSAYGVALRSTLENIDETPTGKLMLNIALAIHQFDNDVKGQTVKDNMANLGQQGWWMGNVPLGLKLRKVNVGERDKNGKQKYHNILVPDDTNNLASKIQQILIRFSEGDVSQTDMVKLADRLNIRSKNGNKLNVQAIKRLLEHPAYAGYNNSKKMFNGKMTKVKFEGLIPLSVYEKNQRILARAKRNYTPHENTLYPLLHTLKCSCCGKNLLASAPRNGSKNYSPRYHCRDSRHGSIGVLAAHNTFNEFLQQITPNEGTVKLFKEIVRRTSASKLGDINREIGVLERKKNKLNEERLSAVMACLEDKITKEEKEFVCQRIDEKRNTIEEDIDRLSKIQHINESTIDYVCSFIDMPAKLWRDADFESKQAFQKMMFPNGLHFNPKTKTCGTEDLSPLFSVVSTKKASEDASNSRMVTRVRFERTTFSLGRNCSIR